MAVLLLAVAPGGISAIQFTSKVRGEIAFAAAMSFLLVFVSIFLTPVIATIILPSETLEALPYLQVLVFIVLFLVFPLLVGAIVRSTSSSVADGLYKVLNVISFVSFVGAVFLSMSMKKAAAREIGVTGMAAMFLLILGSMAIGWLLGGGTKGTRRVVTSVTGVRNVALCLLMVLASFPDRDVDLALMAYVLLVIPSNLLFTLHHTIESKRQTA